ncbi:unnamed protein product, partial [marine sediment metagenome]
IRKANVAEIAESQRRTTLAEEAAAQTKLDADEKAIQKMLEGVKAADGDMEVANKLASWQRTLMKDQATHTKDKRQMEANQTKDAVARKQTDADTLSQKYGIDKEPLLEAKSPEEMRVMALEAYVKTLESGKKPAGANKPTSTDKGPTGGKTGDLQGKSPTELARMAYSNPPKKKS